MYQEFIEDFERQAQDLLVSENRRYNTEVADTIELPHMLASAKAIVVSALERTESRGAHVRSDFPERDDTKPVENMVVQKGTGGCEVRRVEAGR